MVEIDNDYQKVMEVMEAKPDSDVEENIDFTKALKKSLVLQLDSPQDPKLPNYNAPEGSMPDLPALNEVPRQTSNSFTSRVPSTKALHVNTGKETMSMKIEEKSDSLADLNEEANLLC